ncbi:MAG: glucose-6-phosphate isomerase [Rhodothermales bacterium]
MIRLQTHSAASFLKDGALSALRPRIEAAHRTLIDKNGAGHEFLGWRDLLLNPNDALIEDIAAKAEEIRERADVLVTIGIGGSYLGAMATIQALTPYFNTKAAMASAGASAADDREASPEILFAGHHMSGAYIRQLLAYLEGKSVYLNVISKSGTTLEPALAFRFLRGWMEERFTDADSRIVVTTDPESGALNQLQQQRGYKKYVIPPDVGGRFSVLTPVGLLPIAVAGVDIRSLFYGAVSACKTYSQLTDDNIALEYAGYRYLLSQEGYATEVLATFEPRLSGIGGWWQQLFGESEGKEHKGLFPVSLQYSTDLHSVGQYVQEGQRKLIETFLMAEDDDGDVIVPSMDGNLDKLNYLTGKSYSEINRKAYEGTSKAHTDGGVPNMTLWLSDISPNTIGEAYYFFEHAVAVSGYLLGVNPFDQPGVEAYKKEMFSLLGKP